MSDFEWHGLSFHGDLLRALLRMLEPPLPEEDAGQSITLPDHKDDKEDEHP